MKKLILFLAFFPLFTSAQTRSCCGKSATEQFGQLAMNNEFAAGHEAPLPFTFSPLSGQMVTFLCADSINSTAFEIKAKAATNNWLIIVHEWWGLNDYIKQEAERIQGELGNVNVLAIDLYDGKIAETAPFAQQLIGAMKDERARTIIQGAIAHTGTKAKIYSLGWCMGGGWSLQTSLLAGSKSAGCVMYYGMPESDLVKLKKLNGDVLSIFAKKDEWINQDIMKTFEANMKSVRKNLVTKVYDADHAFANPSNPKYDKIAASDAHRLAMDFLKQRLK